MKKKTIKKSILRLAVVQALYQSEIRGQDPSLTIDEFRTHRLNELMGKGRCSDADLNIFNRLVSGVYENKATIDEILMSLISQSREFSRLEPLVRGVLRAATFEMLKDEAVPAKVVVSEYMNLSYAFFSGHEPRFINGILNAVARQLKPHDFAEKAENILDSGEDVQDSGEDVQDSGEDVKDSEGGARGEEAQGSDPSEEGVEHPSAKDTSPDNMKWG